MELRGDAGSLVPHEGSWKLCLQRTPEVLRNLHSASLFIEIRGGLRKMPATVLNILNGVRERSRDSGVVWAVAITCSLGQFSASLSLFSVCKDWGSLKL